jgi:hypothetical protein
VLGQPHRRRCSLHLEEVRHFPLQRKWHRHNGLQIFSPRCHLPRAPLLTVLAARAAAGLLIMRQRQQRLQRALLPQHEKLKRSQKSSVSSNIAGCRRGRRHCRPPSRAKLMEVSMPPSSVLAEAAGGRAVLHHLHRRQSRTKQPSMSARHL